MRITTGKYKGRLLKMPKGIRPTQNKVRKAIFDIMGDISGLSFLELFSGSGAVGIEALSQGAKEVIFVDNNRACAAKIRDNLSVIGLLRYDVIALDAMETIKRLSQEGKRFDIVFLDPPYYKGKALRPAVWRGWRSREEAGESLTKKTLQTISAYDILAPNGLVIAQHFKKETLPERLGVLVLFKRKIYGDTVLSFYKKHCSQGLSPQGTLRRQDKHWLGDK